MSENAQKYQGDGPQIKRNRKIARIWCLAKEIGMDGEMLHVAVESVTGKTSISKLTFSQLVAVVRALEVERKKQKRRRSYEREKRTSAGVAYLPSPEQREKVQLLIAQLAPLIDLRNPDAYLTAICRKSFRKDYSKLGRGEMQALIETLKSIMKRNQNGG